MAFPVQAMCQVLYVSRSGYYAWKKRPSVDVETVALSAEIAAAHKRRRGTYGSPRIHRELRARGIRTSRKRIERLMREKRLKGAQKRQFHCMTDSRHSLPIAPNSLNRDFNPPAADRIWAGDVTYIATDEGWLYLAVMLDLFSRRVVGWSVSSSNDTALASEALRRLWWHAAPEAGLLHHTDRGSPYAALAYTSILRQYGLVASMSRAGDCYGNAVVESFFGTLKAELVRGYIYPSRAVATAAARDYIENYYNTQRRHSHLQYLSPIEFELRSQAAAFAAWSVCPLHRGKITRSTRRFADGPDRAVAISSAILLVVREALRVKVSPDSRATVTARQMPGPALQSLLWHQSTTGD